MTRLCALICAVLLVSSVGLAQEANKADKAAAKKTDAAAAKKAAKAAAKAQAKEAAKKKIAEKNAPKKKEAAAQPAGEATDATFEVVEAQICSGVEKKQPKDNKTSYNTGEKAFLWLKLRPKADTAQMRLRWLLDDKPYWTMDAKPVRFGRVWYNKTLFDPGAWKVEVLDENDNVVHTAELSATGESTAPKKKDAEAPTATN